MWIMIGLRHLGGVSVFVINNHKAHRKGVHGAESNQNTHLYNDWPKITSTKFAVSFGRQRSASSK